MLTFLSLFHPYGHFIRHTYHFGGVGDSKGSQETSGTKEVQAKTPTEQESDQLTLDRLRLQAENDKKLQPLLDAYLADYQAQTEAEKQAGITPTSKAAASAKSLANASKMEDINMELAQANLDAVKQGGKATPEQIANIDAATAAAQKTGEADIERFRTGTLRQINEEIASASGLRPTDTPVVRLSERAGEEAARQQGVLTSTLAGANATARLNYPLAASALTTGVASTQQGLSEAASQFSQQLQMRAQDNRFRLFATNTTANINPISFGSTLGQQRAGNGSVFGNQEGKNIAAGIGQSGSGSGSSGGSSYFASLFA